MGFLDRFRKNKQQEIKQEEQMPLQLRYSDGTLADISFNGSVEVEGKMLHSASIIYTHQNGTFRQKQVLLEPIMAQNEDGQLVDATPSYYSQISKLDQTSESKARYNALKGFFKEQDTTEQIMGSNYIGNLAVNQEGKYYRYFDKAFKARYTEITALKNLAKEEERKRGENDFVSELTLIALGNKPCTFSAEIL